MTLSPLLRRLAGAFLLAGVASCATAPPPANTGLVSLDNAATQVVDSLALQLDQRQGLLASLSKLETRGVVIDPMIDPASGLHTTLAREFDKRVRERVKARRPDLQIVPFSSDSLAKVDLLLIGTIGLDNTGERATPATPAHAQVALLSRRSGEVLARATAHVREVGFDTTPDSFEQDSPVVMMDDAMAGYVQSAATEPGGKAVPYYLRQLAEAAAIDQGTTAYDQGHYGDALTQFRAALADPAGEQMRALNGSYLANVKLGHLAEAQQSFARIVAFGIAHRNLGIKFLFNPGSTDFWPDPAVSGQYDMWLREAARGIDRGASCVVVVGHASRTGTDAVNDRLSEQRAQRIRQRLLADAPKLATRTSAKGVGTRENIVGIGTDDARDAVDRRVGFVFQDCPTP